MLITLVVGSVICLYSTLVCIVTAYFLSVVVQWLFSFSAAQIPLIPVCLLLVCYCCHLCSFLLVVPWVSLYLFSRRYTLQYIFGSLPPIICCTSPCQHNQSWAHFKKAKSESLFHSVSLSVHVEHCSLPWTDFSESWYWGCLY